MSCTDVQTIQAGDGVKTQFSFDFPYIFKSEIHVYFWNVTTKEWDEKLTTDATYPWQVTNANPTIVEFTGTAPPAPSVPTDPGEPTVDNVRIRRITAISDIRALFNAGSAIRSDDLNINFEQLRYAIQESKCEGISDEVYDYLTNYYWNKYDDTIYSADTWVSNDAYVATSQSIDQRIDDKIDTAITSDISGSDGVTITDDGDGTITVGLGAGSIDFDRIKDVDIITEAEQDASSPIPADTNLFTGAASSKRFDTIVSDTTPTGSDWEVGKTWLQQSPDNTLSIWNGTGWIGVASGGTFLTQPTVIYVDAANGNDSFDGHRIINPKKTIKNAVASANAGDIVYVVPGVYQETLPIDITVSNLSIVGQSIRSCFIHPTAATETQTMFRCNSGTYITGFTFAGLKASGTRGGNPIDSDSTYGLPTNQGWVAGFYPGCVVKKSPYIQNCTNFADSGIDNNSFDPNNFQGTGGDLTSAPAGGGILVDGSLPSASSPLRSFVVDSFTQICLDGPGCLVANNGYAQLVSFFGTFCHYHTKALNGGQVNLSNSTTDFGRYGLIADGKSTTAIFTATANGAATAGDFTFAINQPVDNWFGSATRPLDNMMVQIGSDIYPILSSSPNGLGWNVTISNPNPSNRSENLGLDNGHTNGAAVSFFLRSLVSTSGHTFEYVGSGTNYTALPENGGVADELKQAVNLNEGRVWLSSTDQNGKFKVGDTFEVDQKTGFVTIDPQAYSTNLVSDLSPQLGGDLDVLDKVITTTLGNGDVVITPNGTGNVVLDGLRYPEADGTTGQFLQTDGTGNLTFQDAITEVLEDTTPQLGGNLDLNSNNITGTGNVNITGTVTATSFSGSGSGLTGLFENVVEDTTPQLGGDLDVQTYAINTSTTDGDIDLDANGSGLIKVTEFNLSQVPIVTQHDIGTAPNEVPLNGMLGTMAYQDSTAASVDDLVISNGVLVTDLPSGPVGMIARVTDATTPAVGSTVTGGGAAAALCWYNGTNWTVIGV